jgi:excisionase family DNA binding protein
MTPIQPGHECRCSEPLVYKVEQVSEMLNLGLNQVYEGIRRGEIPSVKVGRRILVPRRKLLDMLNGEGSDAAK